MSGTFTIKIDEADLQNVQSMLGGIKGLPERVTVRALNKTLTGVKTDASAEIRAIITAKKAAVDETFKIQKATTSNITAAISSTGKPLALIDYSSHQTKKGVSVQVRKDRSRKIVPAAFISTMKSGHKGVFWREWHGGAKKPVNPKMTYSALPRQYRLKIKELYGPRVPDIMSNEPVMKNVLSKAGVRLHGNLQHETDYELSKL
ncbi:MAG: phage tail protein [Smithella sp.]